MSSVVCGRKCGRRGCIRERIFLDKCLKSKCREKTVEKSGLELHSTDLPGRSEAAALYRLHGYRQESRKVGSFCPQVDQNVLRQSPSPSRGPRACSLGKIWNNGAKSSNFIHSGSKHRVIAVRSAHKKYVDCQKFCCRLIERTLVAEREGSYEPPGPPLRTDLDWAKYPSTSPLVYTCEQKESRWNWLSLPADCFVSKILSFELFLLCLACRWGAIIFALIVTVGQVSPFCHSYWYFLAAERLQ